MICSIIRPVPIGTVDLVMTSFGPFMCCGDGAGHFLDVAEVGRAVRLGRRADGDEDGPRRADGLGQVGGEAQPSFVDVLADDRVEPGLVDRDLPLAQGFDLPDVDVDADHVVAEVGQTGAGDETDVSGADDRDVQVGASGANFRGAS